MRQQALYTPHCDVGVCWQPALGYRSVQAVQKHSQALAQVAQLNTAGSILFWKHVSHQSED